MNMPQGYQEADAKSFGEFETNWRAGRLRL